MGKLNGKQYNLNNEPPPNHKLYRVRVIHNGKILMEGQLTANPKTVWDEVHAEIELDIGDWVEITNA